MQRYCALETCRKPTYNACVACTGAKNKAGEPIPLNLCLRCHFPYHRGLLKSARRVSAVRDAFYDENEPNEDNDVLQDH